MIIRTLPGLLALAIVLAGCSNKPPGCADPEIVTTAKSLLAGKLADRNNSDIDDPDGQLPTFFDRLKLRFINVVDDGYDSQTKKQLCKATMQVAYDGGGGIERQVAYSTQRTVDDKNNFILEMSEGQLLATAVQHEAMKYYNERRWTGEWHGEYSCSGVAGATEGPQGPYTVPVVMTVLVNDASLERTTVGGGFEKLNGQLMRGVFKLSGEGANSPEDQWKTYFHGEPKNGVVEAKGAITLPDGQQVRRCTLALQQAPRQKP